MLRPSVWSVVGGIGGRLAPVRPSLGPMPAPQPSDGQEPNDPSADLRARLDRAEAEIARLRAELVASRAEARELATSIPDAVSRRAVLRSVLGDLAHPRQILAAARRRLRPRRARDDR